MPYKDYSQHLQWCKEYQKKSRDAMKRETRSLETLTLELIRQHPGKITAPMIWESLGGRYTFADVQKTIQTLMGDGYGRGLIEYDRDHALKRGSYPLKPCDIPKLPVFPQNVSAESQPAVG